VGFFHAVVVADNDTAIEKKGHFVYWASSIGPAQIFTQGVRGESLESDNLQRIALNLNCLSTHDPVDPNSSRLIVGTEHRILATRETMLMSQANPDQNFYVYTISSDVFWASLASSLQANYGNRQDIGSLSRAHQTRRTRISFATVSPNHVFMGSRLSQWGAYRNIKKSGI
jgi:hypothetical protein